MMHEYPPILWGSTENQVRQLRDYLVRLVQRINEAEAQEKK